MSTPGLAQLIEDLKTDLRANLTDAQILSIIPAIHHFGLALIDECATQTMAAIKEAGGNA